MRVFQVFEQQSYYKLSFLSEFFLSLSVFTISQRISMKVDSFRLKICQFTRDDKLCSRFSRRFKRRYSWWIQASNQLIYLYYSGVMLILWANSTKQIAFTIVYYTIYFVFNPLIVLQKQFTCTKAHRAWRIYSLKGNFVSRELNKI